MTQLIVGHRGEVTLPDTVRERYGLSPETPVRLVETRSGILLVPDATKDERFSALPMVRGEPGIRFYMGCPIRTSDGSRIGTISMVDLVPREYSEEQVDVFYKFAQLLERELETQAEDMRDEVTQILNVKGFENSASTALEMCVRLGKSSGLVIFDLDEQHPDNVTPASLARSARARTSATVKAASTDRGPSKWTTGDRDSSRVPT